MPDSRRRIGLPSSRSQKTLFSSLRRAQVLVEEVGDLTDTSFKGCQVAVTTVRYDHRLGSGLRRGELMEVTDRYYLVGLTMNEYQWGGDEGDATTRGESIESMVAPALGD